MSKSYFEVDAMSSSAIKRFIESPRAYENYIKWGLKDKPNLKFGRLVHCLCLDPETLHSEFEIVDVKSKNTKTYKDAVVSQPNKTIVTQEDLDTANRMIDALGENKEAADLLLSHDETDVYEYPIYFERQGVECKALIDKYRGRTKQIIDLKTTTSAVKRSAIVRTIEDYMYYIQASFYTYAVQEHFGEYGALQSPDVEFLFVFVDKTFEHNVRVVRLSDTYHDVGNAMIANALAEYKQYKAAPEAARRTIKEPNFTAEPSYWLIDQIGDVI